MQFSKDFFVHYFTFCLLTVPDKRKGVLHQNQQNGGWGNDAELLLTIPTVHMIGSYTI